MNEITQKITEAIGKKVYVGIDGKMVNLNGFLSQEKSEVFEIDYAVRDEKFNVIGFKLEQVKWVYGTGEGMMICLK